MNHQNEKPVLSESDFIAGFHAIGEERYHHKHPFHKLMHEGALSRGQMQAWALNRYYYQSHIPRKDSALLARSDDQGFRVAWRKRLEDHDGHSGAPGGVEKWLKLVEATGLPSSRRRDLLSTLTSISSQLIRISKQSPLPSPNFSRSA